MMPRPRIGVESQPRSLQAASLSLERQLRRSKRLRALIALAISVTLVMTGSAEASTTPKAFAKCHVGTKTCVARGQVSRPRKLFVGYRVTPRQRVTIRWNDSCNVNGVYFQRHGKFKTAPGYWHLIANAPNPRSCLVFAVASIHTATGGMTIWIGATH
jgi:hypothetical protein